MAVPLHVRLAQRHAGICLYGLAPPKRSTAPEQLQAIAAQQLERLAPLERDGVIVYDIQDEAERTAEPRPIPFLPTLEPDVSADVRGLAHPKVVYRCVASDTREGFARWLGSRNAAQHLTVLVGAPSRRARVGLRA
jgi:hypothetical protein